MTQTDVKRGSKSSEQTGPSNSRGEWSSGLEFLLSCISISVGLGNVWRFPTLAYANGGGAFLIPYFIVVMVISKPLYYMELAFGQFASRSPVRVWSCVPAFRGIGFAQMISTFFLTVFINYIMAISLFYMFASMQNPLPWVSCESDWVMNDTCFDSLPGANASNATLDGMKNAMPASEIYFKNYVLQDKGGLVNMSLIDWRVLLCLLLCWSTVCLATIKGVQSLGKVVYATATYPYIVLVALLILALTMDGAKEGLLYFFTPDWKRLLEIKVWYKAAEQSFFSLNTGFGHLIMYASYNNFRHKVNTDALVISLADTITSVLAGSVVFSVLGTLAFDMKRDIANVVKDGELQITFVAYPEALGRIGVVPQLWSILFFIMLFMLGLGSAIGHVESILTTIKDEAPKTHEKKWMLAVGCCILCFLSGIPLCTDAGQYVLRLMDNYGVGAAVFLYGILEFVGIMWIYGFKNYFDDVHFMLGSPLNIVWKIILAGIAPVCLIVVYLYGTVDLIVEGVAVKSGMPDWANTLGWVFAAICISQIPIWFIIYLVRNAEGTILERLKSAFRPSAEWGPSDPKDRQEWLLWKKKLVDGVQVETYENPAFHM